MTFTHGKDVIMRETVVQKGQGRSRRARGGLVGQQHRRLAALHDVAWAARRCGRVGRHDLADNEPVEQMADRRQPLLGGRRRSSAVIDGTLRCSHQARDIVIARHPGRSNRLRVGAAGVAIADIGGEEFEEPDARLVAGCDDESGGGLGRPEKDQLAHSAQGQLETGHPAMCTLLRV
jgi:hypothetical protein